MGATPARYRVTLRMSSQVFKSVQSADLLRVTDGTLQATSGMIEVSIAVATMLSAVI
jgi:hypothetical protein